MYLSSQLLEVVDDAAMRLLRKGEFSYKVLGKYDGSKGSFFSGEREKSRMYVVSGRVKDVTGDPLLKERLVCLEDSCYQNCVCNARSYDFCSRLSCGV